MENSIWFVFKGRIIDLLEASLLGYELIIIDKRKKIIKIYQKNNNVFNVSIELDNSNHIEKIQTSKINWADKSKIEIIDSVILPKNIEEILKKGETYELKYIFVNEQKNDFHGFIDDVYNKEMDYPYLNKIFDSDESGFKQLKVKIFKINYDKFYEFLLNKN